MGCLAARSWEHPHVGCWQNADAAPGKLKCVVACGGAESFYLWKTPQVVPGPSGQVNASRTCSGGPQAVYINLLFLCWRRGLCRRCFARGMFLLCVYRYFFSCLLHQMLTSGNSPASENSLVLHQVIPKFHKCLTFQNTFFRQFLQKSGGLLEESIAHWCF